MDTTHTTDKTIVFLSRGIDDERTADEITARVLTAILDDLQPASGDRVAVMVNGLGATPPEELYILYRRARQGNIPNFTGIDSLYEDPENAELVIDTDRLAVEEGLELLLDYLQQHSFNEVLRVAGEKYF